MFKFVFLIFLVFANDIDKDIISNLDFYLSYPVIESDEVMEIEGDEQAEALILGEEQ